MEHKATECLGVRMATKSFGKRRWLGAALAALCTIALALVLAPMPALADEDLQAKVDKGGTVQLSADVAADIVVSKDVTLDLNGRTLTNASGDTITVKAGANLTVIGKAPLITSPTARRPSRLRRAPRLRSRAAPSRAPRRTARIPAPAPTPTTPSSTTAT
jgi:hypothetical protein